MSKKCPKCGYSLKIWDVRAECPKCQTNIPNYKWEERLEKDADDAELAFARMHYSIKNFKQSVCGSKLRIIRLVLTFAPLIALVLPLYSFKITLPFYEETQSISFLTFILNYLLKTDIGSVLKILGGNVIGHASLMAVIACLLLLFAVVCGVLNFFVLLISGFKMSYMFNVILNALATASFGTAALFFSLFTKACTELDFGIITEGTLGYGFIVGVALFGINLILNIIVGRDMKKQYRSQPSLDEFVENELRELAAEKS